jgi:glyoxylase-like metal-dependent hydrolase (beta-lactamase superfamily II)
MMADQPSRVVKDSMLGMRMPDIDRWSDRVVTVLGQNPGPFTGPGTNTYLVGTSRRPLLLDTGQGIASYLPLLVKALDEYRASGELQAIVLTHAHPDHLGGCEQVVEHFAPGNATLPIVKRPWPGMDGPIAERITAIDNGFTVETDGATLRAMHCPGHAEDHLCYWLEEERAIFTGDVVLGAGTTVIPEHGGDLADYMRSLKQLLALEPAVIYPAHGPMIHDACDKIGEYIRHRELREEQIQGLLARGVTSVEAMVTQMYADVPEFLHGAAATSVRAHLRKLEREDRVHSEGGQWFLQ